jgi:hypothetical protein
MREDSELLFQLANLMFLVEELLDRFAPRQRQETHLERELLLLVGAQVPEVVRPGDRHSQFADPVVVGAKCAFRCPAGSVQV